MQAHTPSDFYRTPMKLRSLVRSLSLPLGFAASFPAAAAVVRGVPALEVTAPDGAKSLLIGTLHVAYPGLRQPSMSVLQGAKSFVVETSTTVGPQPEPRDVLELTDPDVLNGQATRAQWARVLTDAQVDFLQQRLACNAPQLAGKLNILLMLRSPRTASGIAWSPCYAHGKLSRDAILAHGAEAYGVPVTILESNRDAERRRLAVPDRIYQAQLMAGLNKENLARDFAGTVAALNRGDYAAVLGIASKHRESSAADAALFHQLMVRERNAAWMPQLRKAIDAGNAVVVVGAAHLPGSDGLIALLRASGYKIHATTLPEDASLELDP